MAKIIPILRFSCYFYRTYIGVQKKEEEYNYLSKHYFSVLFSKTDQYTIQVEVFITIDPISRWYCGLKHILLLYRVNNGHFVKNWLRFL